MKKIFTHVQLGLLGLVVVFAVSCKREKIDEVMAKETYPAVSLSLSTKTEIGTGSSVTVTGSEVTLPVTVTFSAPTSRAFTVNTSINVDTVAQLITAGTLPAGTVTLPSGAAGVASVLNVPIGVTSVTFPITVSRSTMELFYGKNLAFVVKLSNPSKGNVIAAGKNSAILVVKTSEVLAANSIHEISFNIGNKIFPVGLGTGNYEQGSESITVNIPLKLQGDVGATFTVDAVSVPDSVTKNITNGTLPNSQLYADSKFSIVNPQIRFLANVNSAVLSFSTKISALLGVQSGPGAPTGKLPTIAFKIQNTTKYQITNNRNTVYVTLDANFFRPYYGVPFLIKGDIGAVSDPIYAAYYDFGGEGIAYRDNNTKDGDGGWRAPDNVDVAGDYTPRTAVGWIGNDEYLTFSVFVEKAGTYEMNTLFGSTNANGRATVFFDNVLITPTQIQGLNTGAYGNQKPILTTVTIATPGYHIMKIYFNVGQFDYRGAIFTRKS